MAVTNVDRVREHPSLHNAKEKKNQNSEMETLNKRLGGYAIEMDLIHKCGGIERAWARARVRENESKV